MLYETTLQLILSKIINPSVIRHLLSTLENCIMLILLIVAGMNLNPILLKFQTSKFLSNIASFPAFILSFF